MNEEIERKKRRHEALRKRQRRQRAIKRCIIIGICLIFISGAILMARRIMTRTTTAVIGGKSFPAEGFVNIGEDGQISLAVELIKSTIDPSIFWDSEKSRLTVTNSTSVINMNTDELTYYVNNEPLEFQMPVFMVGSKAFIPDSTLEILYGYKSEYSKWKKQVILTKISDTQKYESKWAADGKKITAVWDQILKPEQNNSEAKRLPIKDLDVIMPTWFSLENGEGDIKNIADHEYVDWVHKSGYQVWALFSNSFDGGITHEALSNSEVREKIIRQLLAYAALYELDGINIDFESVAVADGEYYIQFIRELTPYLRSQGLIVSVDIYVPSPWTEHYGREQVSEVVDYMMVMAYDEHYGGSKVSGSVSSIDWVEDAITSSLEVIPKEKLILGVPFYTRLWEETPTDAGTAEVTSSALSMNAAANKLKEKNAIPVFDDTTKQNYGQFEENGKTYKIWIEDENSMKARMELAKKYDIAGVAPWKRGLEKDGIWDIINSYMGK